MLCVFAYYSLVPSLEGGRYAGLLDDDDDDVIIYAVYIAIILKKKLKKNKNKCFVKLCGSDKETRRNKTMIDTKSCWWEWMDGWMEGQRNYSIAANAVAKSGRR